MSWDTILLSSDILIGCKLAYLMPRQILGRSVICCLVGNLANSGIVMFRSFEYPPQGNVSCVYRSMYVFSSCLLIFNKILFMLYYLVVVLSNEVVSMVGEK